MNYVKSLAKQLGPEGHPGQRRGARTDLDSAASLRRRLDGEAGKIRRPRPRWGGPASPRSLRSIYVQLAAADASFATGQIYGSAGGGQGQP